MTPLENDSPLFWLALTVLASRVLLELGRGARALRLRVERRLAAWIGPPRVVLVGPAASMPGPVAAPTPPAHADCPAAANLLETMSHAEMDRLLSPFG